MNYTEFLEEISGAEYLYTDEYSELVCVWHGGSTVNIYHYTPDDITETDVFTHDGLTKDNIRCEMEDYIEFLVGAQ